MPGAGAWSVGKDAAHVAEAGAYHQWIVRTTIGQQVGSRRPPIERAELTTPLEPAEIAARIRARSDEGIRLIGGLTDDQLDLETKPPRARGQRLAETIQRVLIDHVDGHRAEIERKLAG